MDTLTAKLGKVRDFYHQHLRMPSFSELQKIFGYKSKNSVHKLVTQLVAAKLLSQDRLGRLLPGKSFSALRVLGTVEAGFPSPAEEELSDTISLDDWLITNKAATFMIKVQGDSMIGAGIMPGDMVIVERGTLPHTGNIVVAEVDGAWTLKYLRKEGKTVYLEAANAKYPPIIARETLKVAAVVTAVIRKY